jgi:fructose-1,6-bisphosphatase/inositol monophosphatase family enzyme
MSSGSLQLPVGTSGDDALTVARRCAEAGGRLARERFRQPQSIGVKGRGNIVTDTDLAVESHVARLLSQEFPDHALLSEESNAHNSAATGWLWVLDPLDGTRNYASGIPFFCTNLALCHDGEPVVGVTYDPLHEEIFAAVKGRGAWVNDEPIRASEEPSLEASVLGIDMGYDDVRGAYMLKLLQGLWPGVQSVRIPGSAALGLAYAACGRYDLFVHNCLFPWDVAAGILLVREAGGAITDREGGAVSIHSEGVIAGGALAHADFLRLAAGRPWRDGESH